jgi:hypothetical protein
MMNKSPEAMPKLIEGRHDWLEGSFERPFIVDAINAAYQRYNGTGDVEGALIWLFCIFGGVRPNADAKAWAERIIGEIAHGPL